MAIFGDDTRKMLFEASLGSLSLISFTFVAQLGLGAWFAFLISYNERLCSPSRFFLEGLVFPGVSAILVQGPFLLDLFGLGG